MAVALKAVIEAHYYNNNGYFYSTHLSGALSALQSSFIAMKIHLYELNTHTHAHAHTHTHASCSAVKLKQISIRADLKETADSEFQIALEKLFQRVGAECEKARWP